MEALRLGAGQDLPPVSGDRNHDPEPEYGSAPLLMTTASSGTLYGLQDYVRDLGAVLDRRPAMPVIIREVSALTKKLVADDRWLDERFRVASQDHYTRH